MTVTYPSEDELRRTVSDALAAAADDEKRNATGRLWEAINENGDTNE